MCDLSIMVEERGIARGKAEGEIDKTRQVVENMLRRGNMTDSDICAIAECDMDLVNEVRATL